MGPRSSKWMPPRISPMTGCLRIINSQRRRRWTEPVNRAIDSTELFEVAVGRVSRWKTHPPLPSAHVWPQTTQTLYTRASQWVLSNVRPIFRHTKLNGGGGARFGYHSCSTNNPQPLAGVEIQRGDRRPGGRRRKAPGAYRTSLPRTLTSFGNPDRSPVQIPPRITDSSTLLVGPGKPLAEHGESSEGGGGGSNSSTAWQ